MTSPQPARPGLRAVIGVIQEQGRFLVIERASHIRAGGMICFPGGGIESGESDEAALVRELFEELGIRVQAGDRLFQSFNQRGVELNWYAATIDAGQVIRPEPTEVASFNWLTRQQMLGLKNLLPSNVEFLEQFQS